MSRELRVVWAPTEAGLHVHLDPTRPAGEDTVAIESAHSHDGMGAHTHTDADNGMPRAVNEPSPSPEVGDPDLYAPPGHEWEFEITPNRGRGGPILSYNRHLLGGLMDVSLAHDLTNQQVVITCVTSAGIVEDAPRGEAAGPRDLRDSPPPPSRGEGFRGVAVDLPVYPPLSPGEVRAVRDAQAREMDGPTGRDTLYLLPQGTSGIVVAGLTARGMVAPLWVDDDEGPVYLTARGLGAHTRMRQTPDGPPQGPGDE